ncbi:folylpolyglutamate synthase/dihydrofolate synthase family protein [Geobacter sp. SVR]|uniref:bifunctional folylpolyglutamate synthase/dihydrofolate synthase n=1 Tax=Geobacter sp. SVR TaxID=2495594 RepID=UPI00143EFACA|nr:folylpolyglutamate synthase/dihydrofolate synthase family protein [Geobacter sp. SVR]BCS52983.1 bifunctional folylpolyglutamate synthase/dihydrofolate synthase [Geobacter sp. SVR]GCF84367.1 bifunctional folylpolyglutamate synthase/dihydrofolate synthase [Geobacter sp. SVR]
MPLAGMLEKLYARRRFGIRPGVERVRLLLDRLGNPERSFRSIHVVGTNGKGSTSAFLSSILSSGGIRTAQFSSPHLVDFSERFRVNGGQIESETLAARLGRVLSNAPEDATFFEIVTALAALSFAEEKVEAAVMEAGMGGRSDATAALPGIMTLVTPIALDHCEYLGTTLEQIAFEKSGIIEPESTAVIACQAPAVRAVFECYGRENSVRTLFAGDAFRAEWNREGTLDYQGVQCSLKGLKPGIPGRYQADNAALALAAAEALAGLGFPAAERAMQSGLATAYWPGRMEMVPGRPPLLLDGAHNPAGAAALAAALSDYNYRRLLLVIGVMADKEVGQIIAPLAPLVTTCYCVTPAVERALDDLSLSRILGAAGIPTLPCGSVANGITTAQSEAGPDDLILVCGSLFTVGEAKAWLTGRNFKGIRG